MSRNTTVSGPVGMMSIILFFLILYLSLPKLRGLLPHKGKKRVRERTSHRGGYAESSGAMKLVFGIICEFKFGGPKSMAVNPFRRSPWGGWGGEVGGQTNTGLLEVGVHHSSSHLSQST